MDKYIKKLLGEGTYPFPPESQDFGRYIAVYPAKKMALFIPRRPIPIPKGLHAHDSYEFSVPLTLHPLLQVEKNKVRAWKNMLFPCNPGQLHGSGCFMPEARLWALQIDKDFLLEIAKDAFGIEKVTFTSESCRLDPAIEQLIHKFTEEAQARQAGYEFILDSLSAQLVVALLRQVKNSTSYRSAERHIGRAEDSVTKAIDFLQGNYQNDFCAEEVARVANMSLYHFIRVFKSQTGKTPYQYLMEIKIEKAKELLSEHTHTISEICYLCGFSNHSHFTATFKKKVGLAPSEYRQLRRA